MSDNDQPLQFPRRREITDLERQIEEAAATRRQVEAPSINVTLNHVNLHVEPLPNGMRSLSLQHQPTGVAVTVVLDHAVAHQVAGNLVGQQPGPAQTGPPPG